VGRQVPPLDPHSSFSFTWIGDLSAKARQEHIKAYGYESVYTNEVRVACKVLVSAVGGLIELAPWPSNVPGKEKFRGTIMRSAR
jgi:hypothetical protein